MCDFNNLTDEEKLHYHQLLTTCANNFGGLNFFLQLIEKMRKVKNENGNFLPNKESKEGIQKYQPTHLHFSLDYLTVSLGLYIYFYIAHLLLLFSLAL